MSLGITDSGRVVHAQAMAGQTFHLAWGGFPAAYADPWLLGQTPPTALSQIGVATLVRGAGGNLDPIVQIGVMKVISLTQTVGGNTTTFVQGVSFQLSGNAVDWSIAGANPKPAANSSYNVTYRYIYTSMTALLNEFGRRSPLLVGYAYPDVNGSIIANGGSWTYTSSPTGNLYLQFKFDPTDAVGSIVSQIGIFLGTTAAAGVTPGTQYLTPIQVGNPGQLYMLDNQEPFSRFAGKREIYEMVISF